MTTTAETITPMPLRLVDAPPATQVRLADGRLVVTTGAVIQGTRFVREVFSDLGELPLGPMEIQHGDQLVTVGGAQ